MINTTLCYIRRGEEYLMLHRIKKKHDLNQDCLLYTSPSPRD